MSEGQPPREGENWNSEMVKRIPLVRPGHPVLQKLPSLSAGVQAFYDTFFQFILFFRLSPLGQPPQPGLLRFETACAIIHIAVRATTTSAAMVWKSVVMA